jgi:Trypsin-like serine proteases, typically periplasmic, contain C-terminal PDZ domain
MPMWVVLALAGALLFGLGALSGHLVSSGEGHRREMSRSDFRGRMGFDGGTGNRVGPMHPGGDPGNGGRSGNGPGIAGPANAYLGVSVRDSSTPPGAELVRVVASSPAADAGLEVGDVITAIDGAAVNNAAALTSRVRSYGAGDQLTIAYARAGANQTTKATLASRAQLPQQ